MQLRVLLLSVLGRQFLSRPLCNRFFLGSFLYGLLWSPGSPVTGFFFSGYLYCSPRSPACCLYLHPWSSGVCQFLAVFGHLYPGLVSGTGLSKVLAAHAWTVFRGFITPVWPWVGFYASDLGLRLNTCGAPSTLMCAHFFLLYG